MSPKLAWVLALVWGPTVASAQCYEDTHCFYTCGYGYYQRASVVKVLLWQGPSSAPVRPSSGLALGSPGGSGRRALTPEGGAGKPVNRAGRPATACMASPGAARASLELAASV